MPEHEPLEESFSFNRNAISYIHEAAERGVYDIRGMGAKRRMPTFDDLVLGEVSQIQALRRLAGPRCVEHEEATPA